MVFDTMRILVERPVQVFKRDRHSELCSWFKLERTEDESGEEKIRDIHEGMIVLELLIDSEVIVVLIDFHAGNFTFLSYIIVRTVTVGHILVIKAGTSVETLALSSLDY